MLSITLPPIAVARGKSVEKPSEAKKPTSAAPGDTPACSKEKLKADASPVAVCERNEWVPHAPEYCVFCGLGHSYEIG